MKIALVHDFLTQDGGAEKVLQVFTEMYPEAPIYMLFYDKNKVSTIFQNKNIITSFLQKIPFSHKSYQWFLPLMPIATEQLDLSDYDVVLSSTSAFMKGVITSDNATHVCYCHTPTRYLWTDTHDYIKNLPYNGLIKFFIPFLLHKLRIWDLLATKRVDHFVANSHTVEKRISKYYKRESTVIYPPVECEKFKITQLKGDFYLCGARLVPYKKIDLVIEAFNKTGKKLKVFGTGPEMNYLKKLAGDSVEILGKVSDTELIELYAQAKAFIHPQEEDFGITPVESMASGTPVIAYGVGGATETVIHKKTGYLFNKQTPDALVHAIDEFEKLQFNPQAIRQHALNFDKKKFKAELHQLISSYNTDND
jgi:glycosyltransferase involved in cell wall biosynthesis